MTKNEETNARHNAAERVKDAIDRAKVKALTAEIPTLGITKGNIEGINNRMKKGLKKDQK